MILAVTGHRDRLADPDELIEIVAALSPELIAHGGARGFDTQVAQIFSDIEQRKYLPDYERFGRKAPLRRNILILEAADHLLALYDGRPKGGTLFTITEARKRSLPVTILAPR